MNGTIQIMLISWNLLLIPGIVYVIRLEKRLAQIEAMLEFLSKDKCTLLEK